MGTVYLGAARGDTVYVEKLCVSRPDRALIRARAAQDALVLALRLAQDKVPASTKPLAAADCPGLCPRCGKKRADCTCPPAEDKAAPVDARLAILKSLLN